MEANRDFLKRYVDAHLPGMEMIVPEGTYLAWLDCRGARLDAESGDSVGDPCEPGTFFLEQARVALFLASEMSSYVTGHNIPVDGGTKAGGGWFWSPDARRFVNRPTKL